MGAISKAWVTIADGAVDPDSPIDASLMTGLRDDLVHLREWLGFSYEAGAVQDHNHDGVNSAPIAGEIGHTEVWSGWTLPAGTSAVWDWCDGGTLSRSTYASLKNVLMTEATVTISIASPAVVTWNAHGLRSNLPIRFFTTGALPTGITAGTHGAAGVGTEYYVSVIDANTFHISATPGGANINTSGTQSGTHTGTVAPHGDGDGSTTFHKPDYKGRVPVGRDDMGGTAANRMTSGGSGITGNVLGRSGGAETVTLASGNVPALTHNHFEQSGPQGGGTGATRAKYATGLGGASSYLAMTSGANASALADLNTENTTLGSGGAHNNTQPSIVEDWIIRIA